MNLLSMSFLASIIILAIVIIRILLIHKLPKKVFLILWSIALIRLLIPFSFPSTFSIYSLVGQDSLLMDFHNTFTEVETKDEENISDKRKEKKEQNETISTTIEQNQKISIKDLNISTVNKSAFSIWKILWLMGTIICATVFFITYILCYKEFRTSLPIENTITKQWLLSYKIRRTISFRQLDSISAPLTYGIFRPVILMPKTIKWENSKQLQYMLIHEFIHIQRLDAITKLLLIIAVCIHWFNPLVWLMYVLFNRDLEISCDEAVIRYFGEDSKSSYALALIHMEEKKSGLIPLESSFSKYAIEERITAIMKIQKTSLGIGIFVITFIICLATTITTSKEMIREQKVSNTVASFWESQSFLLKSKKNMDMQSLFGSDKSIIDIETKLSSEEQEKLLKKYEEYDVYKKDGILYYQEEPIRCLLDQYREETGNGNGGRNINTIRVYTYFNEKGTIDMRSIRDYKIGKTEITELFLNIIDLIPIEQEEIQNIPQKSINTLARRFAKEGDYNSLNKIIDFVDIDMVDEIAKEVIETKYKHNEISDVKELFPWISQDVINESIKKIAQTGMERFHFFR